LPPPADIPDDARAREFPPLNLSTYHDFYLRVLSGSPIPETETNDEVPPQSAALQRLGSRVIGPATAKHDCFAITVKRTHGWGIVPVDLERGAPVN
jgi:hypothetical protein